MGFVRGAWHILVAVKDLLVLLLLLLFFGGIYAALSMTGAERPSISDGALVIQLDGVVVEQPSEVDSVAALAGEEQIREYRLRDIVGAIEAGAKDSKVKAIVVDLDGFMGAGQVALARIGDALDMARAAKKPVLAYAGFYTDDSYFLAAHASEVWLNPIGAVALTGPGGSRLYYKGLIDKLGITTHVYRVGTYKSFVEPFERTDSSPEAEEADRALLGALWQAWQDDVRKARPKANIAAATANPEELARRFAGNGNAAAKALGLIDREGDRTAFGTHVATLVGTDDESRPGNFAAIDFDTYVAAQNDGSSEAGKVGVITVAGDIIDGEAGSGTAGGDSVASLINDAVASGEIKALVVRIDSPGGSVLASEQIRQALLNARNRKIPVVASMANVAASGGYWISTAATRIYAEPETVTGSIGVFGILPSFETTLARIGITSDSIKTTPLSGEPDVAGGVSPGFNALAQASVEDIYRRFVGLVAEARGMDAAAVDRIAQGRVWDGGTARQLKLVDGFGGIEAAVAEAAKMASLSGNDAKARYFDPPQDPFAEFVSSFIPAVRAQPAAYGDWIGYAARMQRLRAGQVVSDVSMIMAGAGVRADCLMCRDFTAAGSAKPPKAGSRDWMAALSALGHPIRPYM